jgi:hypothetical protein|tara:strand:- start:174 stop:449 length:276 start_codon:yes stop_codon:yes gene_type:complete
MGRDPKKVTGDINEFRAVIKFLKEGYMVFKNVSGTGPIDMVLIHQETGEIRKIDVKTTSYRQSWKPGTRIHRQRTKEQIRLGVEYEFLDKD